jgi:hypothetical protein
MSTIVTRAGKGASLSWTEMDANLNNLNNDKTETSTLSAATGSSLSGHISSLTNAVARTVQDTLRERVSVLDFLSSVQRTAYLNKTNDTDMTVAINEALLRSAGRDLYFPPGLARITGTLSFTVQPGKSAPHIIGSGIEATILYFDNGASDCMVFAGTDTGSNQLNGFQLRDMSIKMAGTKTNGRTLALAFAYKTHFENLYIENAWAGFEIYVTNNCDLRNVNFQVVRGTTAPTNYYGPAHQAPARSYALYWHAPSDGSFRSDALRTINVTAFVGYSGAVAFLWDGAASTWDAFQLTALNSYYGLWIRNTGQSTSNYPVYGEFHNFNTDGVQTTGLRIDGGAQIRFVGCNITNTTGSSGQGNADTYAVHILGDTSYSLTRALAFETCQIGGNRQHGVYVDVARDIQFNNCYIVNGGQQAAGTYSGIYLNGACEDILINGNKFSLYGANNNWLYGVYVSSTAARVLCTSNYMYSIATNPKMIQNNSTDSNTRIYGNMTTNQFGSDEAVWKNNVTKDLTSANATLTGVETASGILLCINAPAGRSVTFASAANIIGALPNPAIGNTYTMTVINTSANSVQTVLGANCTGSGNASGGGYVVGAGASRTLLYRIQNPGSGSESIAFFG